MTQHKTQQPIRFALIGAGMVSDAHARSLSELSDAQLVVIYSRTDERAQSLADRHGVAWSTDLDETLNRNDIDAVVITTAPYNHAPHAIDAMTAGKHALIEKPMATTPAECDAMTQATIDHQRIFGVVHQNRFRKPIIALKRFVESGSLGSLLHVSGRVKWYRPQSYYSDNDWRGLVETEGGGVIFSQAGHTLDLMQWIGGPIDWVFTNMTTAPVHTDIDIENLGTVTMRFANGATGVLEASTALYPGTPERLEVHGTRGTIIIEGGVVKQWEIQNPTADDEPGDTAEETGSGASDPMAFPITWHKLAIADFIAAIRDDREPAVDARAGRMLIDLCEHIYQSACDLAPVHVNETPICA